MKDLIQLYSVESVHPHENDIYSWIVEWMERHDIKFDTDGKNIWKLTGEQIILSAHMDQVKTNGRAVHFYQKDKMIRGYNKDYEQTSLGADDKNGVWIILKCLEDDPNTNFIISHGEESGCVGISELKNVLKSKVDHNNICIVLDRRGFGEVLDRGSSCSYCNTLARVLCNYWNQDFEDEIFCTGGGTVSDANAISEYCECVNVSVAYYNPHTKEEKTNFDELLFTMNMVKSLKDFVYYPCKVETFKTRRMWEDDRLDYGYNRQRQLSFY